MAYRSKPLPPWTFTAIAACRQHWDVKVFTRTQHKKLWETEHAAHASLDLGLQSTCSRLLSEPFRILALQMIGGSWCSSLASICSIFLYYQRRLSLLFSVFVDCSKGSDDIGFSGQLRTQGRHGLVAWEWGKLRRYVWVFVFGAHANKIIKRNVII